MKHTVLYGSARTGVCLIVAIKKSQRFPFPSRHDCRLTAACTNETHRNKWVRAHSRLSPSYQCVKPAPSKGIFSREGDPNTKICYRYGVQSGVRLRNIDGIKKRPALYDCPMKEYSDKVLKDRLWGEVCEAVVSECSQLDGPEKREKDKQCYFFNIFKANAQVYINLL